MEKRFWQCFVWFILFTACTDRKSGVQDEPVVRETDSLPTGSIPISYKGHLYVKGIINDSVMGNFLFDTGAVGLYVDSVFLASSGWVVNNKAQAFMRGAGRGLSQVHIMRDSVVFRVDTLTHKPQYTVIIQLRPIVGRQADGLFGWDHLRDYAMQINYIKEYIRLLPADSIRAEGYQKLPFVYRKGKLFVKAALQVDHRTTLSGEFLVDLGSGGGVDLTRGAAVRYRLDSVVKDKVKCNVLVGGIGGGASGYEFRADSFKLGDFTLARPISSYSENTGGAFSDRDYLGLLGNDILDRFDLIIDFPGEALYIRPNVNFGNPYQRSRAGFSYVDRTDIQKGWIVNSIYEGAAADVGGLMLGDCILFVNWKNVEDITDEEWRKLVREENGGVVLSVMRDGEDKLKEITLYFKDTKPI